MIMFEMKSEVWKDEPVNDDVQLTIGNKCLILHKVGVEFTQIYFEELKNELMFPTY